MRNIRILQLAKYSPFKISGGIESVAKVIHHSPYSRPKFHTLFLDQEGNISFGKFGAKINFHINTAAFSIQYIYIFFRIHKYYPIILGHLPNPLCLIILLSKKYYVFWHADLIGKGRILTFLYKCFELLILKKCSGVIYTSNSLYRYSWTYPQKNFYIFPLSASQPKDELICRNSEFINILCVGRLVDYKNYDFLIKQISKLPNVHLTIIGNGKNYNKLLSLINNLRAQNIRIERNVSNDQLDSFYRCSDVFCLASNSRAEAFGIVLIEALSYSLPILVAENPGSGMMDIVKPGFNGEIFSVSSITEFKFKLNKILDNLQHYSCNAKNDFSNYTHDKFYLNLYSTLK